MECKGQILEALHIRPKVVNFGNLSPEAPTQQIVSLTRGDGGPLSLKLAPVNAPGVEAEVKELEAGERYQLVVSLTPPFKSKRVRTTLRLETGVAESPIATVPVYATITTPREPRKDGVTGPPRP